MIVSRRKYYCNYLISILVTGALILISAPIANNYLFHVPKINEICSIIMMFFTGIIIIYAVITIIINHGIINLVRKIILISYIENNLISIGAYKKVENKNYVIMPKIVIKQNKIIIELKTLKIRTIIERYLNSFSTALPEKYVVENYYISQNGDKVIIEFEDLKNNKSESYSLQEYSKLINSIPNLSIYIDKKHIVNINDYPHFLISGCSGSGKSYLVNEIVIQAIMKKWEVVILDLKRSYGLYRDFSDYAYEIIDIIYKLSSVESEMHLRMKKLQSELDKNPQVVAVDIGYKPKIVIIEEYISLLSSVEKKEKEEIERIVKNLSVLARQSNIHIFLVMQSAGTENVQSTTRSNLTKILLGNAQSNILNATFGNGVDIPTINTKLIKGEGLIQLNRISIIRVPKITDIEDFNEVIGTVQ